MGGQRDTTADLPLRERPSIHCHRRLGGAHRRSGWVWKILPLPGLNPGIIQLVVVAVNFREKKTIPNTLVATTFWVPQSHCNVSDKCFCTVSIRCVIYPRQAITHVVLLAFLKYPKRMYSLNGEIETVKGVRVKGLSAKGVPMLLLGNNQCFKR